MKNQSEIEVAASKKIEALKLRIKKEKEKQKKAKEKLIAFQSQQLKSVIKDYPQFNELLTYLKAHNLENLANEWKNGS